MGFEPTTASLEGWNSTTELRPPTVNLPTLHDLPVFSASNKPAYRHITYIKIIVLVIRSTSLMRAQYLDLARFGGQARIRTLEAIRQQIYSLPPLSTWVPARPIRRFKLKQTAFNPGKSITGAISSFGSENESKPHHAQLPSKKERSGMLLK